MPRSGAKTHQYRSGEAARLADMPVATLRVWEQRYGVVSPHTSESGQRLYSDQDVDRLRLLKALVKSGHAIGTIARLDREALESLLRSPERQSTEMDPESEPWTVIMVGFGALDSVEGVSHFESLEALMDSVPPKAQRIGLMVYELALHTDTVDHIIEAARHLDATEVMIVYSFGVERALELAELGGMTLRKSVDGGLRAKGLLREFSSILDRRPLSTSPRDALWRRTERQFDDATLARLAALSTTIACECPKHLVALVMQLAAFERYSDACLSRSPADALLHRHLGDTANRAVQMFEDVLAEVVKQEQWELTPTKSPHS